MSTQNFEIPTEFRDIAIKSVDQARNAVGNFFESAAKGFDHAQANAHATFDFAQKLAKSRDPREAFEVHSEFVKSQFAALQAQAKEFGSLVQTSVKH